MAQSPNRNLLDYAEIPLALGSFVFFRVTRLVMIGFVGLVNRARRGKANGWRVISADFIAKPLALPVFMTKAPRWNPHAVIATAGPLVVKSSITMDAAQANASAKTWGLSLQPMGRGREERISSAGATDAPLKTLKLPPGNYMVVMRYYGPGKQASLPAIRVDDHDQVGAQMLEPDNNRFYGSLSQRSNWLYAWLGFYVYTMLRFVDWLPGSFVSKQYLPAGDPETRYEFGAVRRGTAQRISVRPGTLSDYAIYFTRYNRASFPVLSKEIDTPDCTIGGAKEDGFYLIRMLLRKGSGDSNADDLLTVTDIVAT